MDGIMKEETNSTQIARETPQTITLGKNGDDTDDHRPTTTTSPSSTTKNGRWLSRLTGWNDTDTDHMDEYQQQLHYNAMGDDSMRGTRMGSWCRENDGAGIHQDAYAALPNDPLAAVTTSPDTTASFFFRSTDTSPRAGVRTANIKVVRNRHAEVFGYRDAVAVVPPAVLQSFRNRYAALNYECVLANENDTAIEHDLELQMSDSGDTDKTMAPQSRRIPSDFSTVSQSALVYEADGKRLMRLPRDQVRLVMDPDLDPGILAAVVVNSSYTQEETKEALEYVLTVDDDLYRRMVAEIATEQFVCVTERGFCDIRIALGVLSVTFAILFVNSLAFHEI